VTDRAALARALDGAGAAFAHVPLTSGVWGPAVGEVGRAIAGALADARVPFTVYSTSGPGTRPGAASTSPHFDGMGAAEQAVLGAGVPALVLRPAGYLDNLSAPFSAPAVLGGAVVYPLPAGFRYRWVSHADQAALVAAALAAVRSRPGAAADLAGRSVADRAPAGRRRARRRGRPRPRAAGPLPRDHAGRVRRHPGAGAGPHGRAHRRRLPGDRGARRRARRRRRTAAGLDALGVALTPVADWARVQDWSGAAAALGGAAAP
jgi:uncharacterized protein YbjT (DUF2867 family)